MWPIGARKITLGLASYEPDMQSCGFQLNEASKVTNRLLLARTNHAPILSWNIDSDILHSKIPFSV